MKVTFAAALALAAATAASAKFLAPDFAPPKTVAVLPLDNESKDADVPEIARQLFYNAASDKGYAVLAPEKVDEALHSQFGVPGEKALKDVDPVKLAAALSVDALIYGTVHSAKSQNVGVYVNKEVELSFRLVSGASGKKLWEERKDAWNKDVNVTAKDAAKSLAKAAADKITKDGGADEVAAKAVKWCAASLPRANGSKDMDVKTKSTSYHHSETTTEEVDE